ncbi:HepT-like ribonuclease domain-containing protein [Spirosoma sp. 48-14]|uniref:HepT-like ribonuclease domain-containing protein n=1 Tax=Spirosoma sp. 48-14 TaxID=1895854 RepID=UPI000965F392|nr:HepT-like ribonuclease domain-containing protein [Spirosoma sp. 48-14]OJW78408.1 MAG: hypothetical protein BGO59_30880 [Spirosoma sp. 48-14]
MPSNHKTDLVYCLRILEAIGKIDVYATGFDDPFVFFEANDQKDFNASLLQLLHIGEQVNRMSEQTKTVYTQIPWQSIKTFRNIVAHDYVGVDKLIVFQTITDRLPELKQAIEHIIRTELDQNNFDNTEYDISKASDYYRHIDFNQIR